MYEVRNKTQLEEIISRISTSEFDRVGHSMYSAGVKKYLAFLIDANLLM